MPGKIKLQYFDVIMMLQKFLYKIITTVGIYTKFSPTCLRHLVQIVLVIACQNIFQQLKYA